MTKPSFQELIEMTRHVNATFEHQMDARDRMLDLVEEVGELAQALLIVEGRKKTNDPAKQKTKEDIADALCDVLYNLIILSQDYKLDLPSEYQAMLDRLQVRVAQGEFSKSVPSA